MIQLEARPNGYEDWVKISVPHNAIRRPFLEGDARRYLEVNHEYAEIRIIDVDTQLPVYRIAALRAIVEVPIFTPTEELTRIKRELRNGVKNLILQSFKLGRGQKQERATLEAQARILAEAVAEAEGGLDTYDAEEIYLELYEEAKELAS